MVNFESNLKYSMFMKRDRKTGQSGRTCGCWGLGQARQLLKLMRTIVEMDNKL